jgi:hypothetical protein
MGFGLPSRPTAMRSTTTPTLPLFDEDLDVDSSLYMNDNSRERVKALQAVFKAAGPKLLKCWDGWTAALSAEIQASGRLSILEEQPEPYQSLRSSTKS